MASSDRVRSLFLSSYLSCPLDTGSNDVGTNTYLQELESHRARIDEGALESGGESGRPSRTSTIRAVENFFSTDYRPPSCRLKRISCLDKDLPAPPLVDSESDHDLTDEERLTESQEYAQTHVAITGRYSARSDVSTVSVRRRGSNRTSSVSVRSRYSTQTTGSSRVSSIDSGQEPQNLSRRLSESSERRKPYIKRQSRGSIPYRGTVLEGVDEEREGHRERETHKGEQLVRRKETEDSLSTAPEKDPWVVEYTQCSLASDDTPLGITSKAADFTRPAPINKKNDSVKKIVRTSSSNLFSFYKQCAASLENRRADTARRKGSRTSDLRQAGLFAGCFWSRDGDVDDIA